MKLKNLAVSSLAFLYLVGCGDSTNRDGAVSEKELVENYQGVIAVPLGPDTNSDVPSRQAYLIDLDSDGVIDGLGDKDSGYLSYIVRGHNYEGRMHNDVKYYTDEYTRDMTPEISEIVSRVKKAEEDLARIILKERGTYKK